MTTDFIRQKQVFIASDSYEIFGLEPEKGKKSFKISFQFFYTSVCTTN
jgi:hypothetical protein